MVVVAAAAASARFPNENKPAELGAACGAAAVNMVFVAEDEEDGNAKDGTELDGKSGSEGAGTADLEESAADENENAGPVAAPVPLMPPLLLADAENNGAGGIAEVAVANGADADLARLVDAGNANGVGADDATAAVENDADDDADRAEEAAVAAIGAGNEVDDNDMNEDVTDSPEEETAATAAAAAAAADALASLTAAFFDNVDSAFSTAAAAAAAAVDWLDHAGWKSVSGRWATAPSCSRSSSSRRKATRSESEKMALAAVDDDAEAAAAAAVDAAE